jgi:hypothetical protein
VERQKEEKLLLAQWLMGGPGRALQLIWPDPQGCSPGSRAPLAPRGHSGRAGVSVMRPQIEALVWSTLVDLDNGECDLDWILSNRVREACPDAPYDVLNSERTVRALPELGWRPADPGPSLRAFLRIGPPRHVARP